jgi:large conductance mechanosensitive channel
MFEGFKSFILRGNAIDLAIGVVIGAAFSAVVDSLVKGVLTPLIGALIRVPNFATWTVMLNGSPLAIGAVINSLLSFVLVAAVLYWGVIIPMNKLMGRELYAVPGIEK